MHAKKSLGQNFLMHAQTAERIVQAAQLNAGEVVLEIGPGTGMLTKVLLAAGHTVYAVETDEELIPVLHDRFAAELQAGQLHLIQGDIRAFDPKTIGTPYSLVANIPYYITGELLRTFLTTEAKPRSITVLVQKEVAERIARSTKESLLSLSVKVFGTPEYCFTVPRGAFMPAPKVDSAVLAIRNVSGAAFASKQEEERFFVLIHAGFAHKRKQLGKNLSEVYGDSSARTALEQAGVAATARAEDLPLASWKNIASHLPLGTSN